MKKYHLMEIYQVSKRVGYLESGEPYSQLTIFNQPDSNYKLEASLTVTNTTKIILVERIFPTLVREVKTGIIFPIVDFKSKAQSDIEYMTCIYRKFHTFVYSQNGKLLSTEITTANQFNWYNQIYPDASILRKELQRILTEGKTNMEVKLKQEMINRQQASQTVQKEKQQLKTLKRCLKQSRRKH